MCKLNVWLTDNGAVSHDNRTISVQIVKKEPHSASELKMSTDLG